MTKRTLFIGDVHGCLEELKLLLNKVNYCERTDRLIYLGDMINKGPSSFETLKFIRLQNVECLLGNNEVAFLNLVRKKSLLENALTDLAKKLGEQLEDYCQWIESFPSYIEEKDFIAVHAGITPGKTIEKTTLRERTTIRTWDGTGQNLNNVDDPNWYDLYRGEKTVIYGHYAAQRLQVNQKTIGLDSGCVFGGELSCLIWPSRKIIQVKAKKQYLKIKV